MVWSNSTIVARQKNLGLVPVPLLLWSASAEHKGKKKKNAEGTTVPRYRERSQRQFCPIPLKVFNCMLKVSSLACLCRFRKGIFTEQCSVIMVIS